MNKIPNKIVRNNRKVLASVSVHLSRSLNLRHKSKAPPSERTNSTVSKTLNVNSNSFNINFIDGKYNLELGPVKLNRKEWNMADFFLIIRYLVWKKLPIGNYIVEFYFDITESKKNRYNPSIFAFFKDKHNNTNCFAPLVSFFVRKEKSDIHNNLNYRDSREEFFRQFAMREKDSLSRFQDSELYKGLLYKNVIMVIEKNKNAVHFPTNPIAYYKCSGTMVIKDRNPNGKFKYTQTSKGVVTVFLTLQVIYELSLNRLRDYFDSDKAKVEITDAFTSYLDNDKIYSVDIILRKRNFNITVNKNSIRFLVSKELMIKNFGKFYASFYSDLDRAISLEFKKYRERQFEIQNVKVVFTPQKKREFINYNLDHIRESESTVNPDNKNNKFLDKHLLNLPSSYYELAKYNQKLVIEIDNIILELKSRILYSKFLNISRLSKSFTTLQAIESLSARSIKKKKNSMYYTNLRTKISDSVDKNKLIKDNRNLHTDLPIDKEESK